jgi:hypothetical protein
MVPDFFIYFTIILVVVIIILNSIILWYSVNQYNVYQSDKQNFDNFISNIKNTEKILIDTQNTIKQCKCYTKSVHPVGCKCFKCCPKKDKKCSTPSIESCSDSSLSCSSGSCSSICSEKCDPCNPCNPSENSSNCCDPYKNGILKPKCY